MKILNLFLLLMALIWQVLPVSAQSFHNPIIPGYHPDPSVCRVGDDFYLVNSSFHYFPGVPIFHSKDMVHWQQIGNVLDCESQLPLAGTNSWGGIYAPTIRYHKGTYYMITTNVNHGGNFLVTAKDPRGPWSEPVKLKQQGIDPSLYFENGKCYMVSNPGDAIWLCEINPQTGEQLTESKMLWQGDGGRYPEGPHIYKKDGYYYLLISEGGTELAHHLTIARSKKIDGPYVSNPNNPILTNCSRLGQTKQIQGTGHGDFVQAKNGSWWLVFLAYRNYNGSYHHLGRETYLAPVKWERGKWPVVNGGQPIDAEVKARTLPEVVLDKHVGASEFAPTTGKFEWVYIQNPIKENYRWMGSFCGDGEIDHSQAQALALKSHGTLSENNQPTFVGRRQESANFELETVVALSEMENQQISDDLSAGLTIYQINDGHIDFVVTNQSVELRCKLKSIDYTVKSVDLVKQVTTKVAKDQMDMRFVKLRVGSDGTKYTFSYSLDGESLQTLGSLDCCLMSTEVAGGFTGVTLGMTAEGGATSTGSAVFRYFHYTEK